MRFDSDAVQPQQDRIKSTGDKPPVDHGLLSSGGQTTRYLLLILAVLMLVGGIFRGELAVIFRKAANICLECIGIG